MITTIIQYKYILKINFLFKTKQQLIETLINKIIYKGLS